MSKPEGQPNCGPSHGYPDFVMGILRDWLKREMSDISEEHYCAGWMIGLEHRLWKAVLDFPEPCKYGMGIVDPMRIQRLAQIANFLGEWAVWSDELGCETTIALDDWRSIYSG